MNYEKLIQPSESAGDEPVEFAAVDKSLLPGPIEREYWVHISERLWERLLSLGTAYSLHFSQTIEPIIDTVLGPEQCSSLEEELVFLGGIINDPALTEALMVMQKELSKVIGRKNMRLVISPP